MGKHYPAEFFVRQSRGAVGSSADNAAAESFDAAFKRETLKGRKGSSSEREARRDAFRWLTRYNTRRRHSRLLREGERPVSTVCRFIHAEKANFTVVLMCTVMQTVRSTYYAWVAGAEAPEARRRADEALRTRSQ